MLPPQHLRGISKIYTIVTIKDRIVFQVYIFYRELLEHSLAGYKPMQF